MGKMDELILVVPTTVLFGDDYFNGFSEKDKVNFEKQILDNYEYKRRGDMEEDPSFKQPIPYVIIVNDKKVFLFQRSKNKKEYTETRLHGKWSCGVGGHVDKVDDGHNPIHASMLRELDEEVHIDMIGEPEVLGYINHDDSEVGKVHLGILYLVHANSVEPKDPEIANGKFRTLQEFEEILSHDDYDVEGWTEIAFEPLKGYFAK